MYDIAEQVEQWLAQGRPVSLGTLIETRGFSSRSRAPFVAWTDGEPYVGRLLTDVGDDLTLPLELAGAAGASTAATMVEVVVTDRDALDAGLSCGGAARVLVQDGAALPPAVWSRLRRREPLCLVTDLAGGGVRLFDGTGARVEHRAISDAGGDVAGTDDDGTDDDAGNDAGSDDIGVEPNFEPLVARLFARGTTSVTMLGEASDAAVVTVLWPVPNLVVVGDGLIATALVEQVALLGWNAQVTGEVDAAVAAISGLSRADALVVLSHDRSVDGPVLAAGLRRNAGYVGALGSRRTQAARAAWLAEHDVSAELIATIHGPAGLDIGAYSPAEIALSIVAEVLAARTVSTGGSLRDRRGPVHVDGLNAPPPRYPIRRP